MNRMKKSTEEDLLYKAFCACFIEPRGDPNRSNLYTAACLAKILLAKGYTLDGDWMKTLRGKDGICNHNFMKEIEDTLDSN